MRYVVIGLLVLLAVLHQDYWWRADDRTLVLGFLPVSLAYHIGISIDACVLWGLACRYCWPRELDAGEPQQDAAFPARTH